jgi:hypothetical protein
MAVTTLRQMPHNEIDDFFAVEIERWRLKVSRRPVHQNIHGLQSALTLKLADKDLYPNIHTVFKLLIVLPVCVLRTLILDLAQT